MSKLVTNNVTYKKDMWIWAEHSEDVWKPGRIIDVTDKILKVAFLNGKTVNLPNKNLWTILSIGSFNEDLQNPDIGMDFSKMRSLSTESVLHFLRQAYQSNTFYNHLGAGTILAVNPFHDVKGLFNKEKVKAYHSATLSELSSLPPHVFCVAERALRNMLNGMCLTNQSIIISGESGAGKTWTVRCLMRYFAMAGMDSALPLLLDGADFADKSDLRLSESFVGDQIEHRILCSNPILEAFGNAATPRNHNSSRFGKFIQLQYDWCGNIVGARLQVYLLEKSRVVTLGKSDKPYHIFSQMLRGSTEAEKTEWLLSDIIKNQENKAFTTNINNNNRAYNLNDSFDSTSEEEDPTAKAYESMDGEIAFKKTRKAMLSVGIVKNVQCQIFKLLSAILHLEKMSFQGDDDLSTPCSLVGNSQLNGKHAASLLSLPINSLLQAVTVREIQAGGSKSRDRRRSVFFHSCTKLECAARRDALMKFLYEQIFLWLVRHIGDDLSSDNSDACSFIGLLDVYGFESFHQNGLEQLCINYANEKLQQYYVNNFLKRQQEELAAEGITWESMSLKDKQGCLAALEAARYSLFSLLNEECRLNRPRNATQLKDRIGEHFSQNSFVTIPRISSVKPCFAVVHYAGTVQYETESLIIKNKDELPSEIAHLLLNSKNDFIQQLILKNPKTALSKQKGGRGKNHETLLTQFKKSLDDLLKTISSTNCHYIRCIKPNKHSLPARFDSFYVAEQLRSSGIVETVQICGKIHPHRIHYQEFITRYHFLTRHHFVNNLCSLIDDYDKVQRTCCKILSAILEKNPHLDRSDLWKFGKTSVFLSSLLFEALQLARSKEMSRSAVKIQKFWIAARNRQRCRRLREQLFEERRLASIVLQRRWKSKLRRRKCVILRKLEIWRRQKAAKLIQARWFLYLKYKEEKQRILEEEAEAKEMMIFPIKMVPSVSSCRALIQSTKLEIEIKKPQSVFIDERSFKWICRPKHNIIERYFPSMVQMNFCRISSKFFRPFDMVTSAYENANFNMSRVEQDSFDYDSSEEKEESFYLCSNTSYRDSSTLPLCSFNLHDQSFSSPLPFDDCILPYSNIKPKDGS